MRPLKQPRRHNQQKSPTNAASNGELYPTPVGPLPLTPVDNIIGQHHGSTVALDATPERLQASKSKPIPTLTQRIEQLSVENGNLRCEISYTRRLYDAGVELEHKARLAREILDAVLSDFEAIQRQVDYERSGMQNVDAHISGEKPADSSRLERKASEV
jgi:hypothetical protein